MTISDYLCPASENVLRHFYSALYILHNLAFADDDAVRFSGSFKRSHFFFTLMGALSQNQSGGI